MDVRFTTTSFARRLSADARNVHANDFINCACTRDAWLNPLETSEDARYEKNG